MNFDKLFQLSDVVGKQIPFYTQGTGGNISLKVGDTLGIKSSGLRLDKVRSINEISELPISTTREALFQIKDTTYESEKAYSALLTGIKKPSMETGMHLVLRRKWVLHFHALSALLMAHEFKKNKTEMIRWMEKTTALQTVVIESTRPGLVLSQRVRNASEASVFILENHGVLLQGEDDTVVQSWSDLEDAFIRDWNYAAIRRLGVHAPTPMRIYFPDTAVFMDRIKNILLPSTPQNGENHFVLKNNAKQLDLDAYEIWWATEILYQACPSLDQLPATISGILPELPTEKYRRGETT